MRTTTTLDHLPPYCVVSDEDLRRWAGKPVACDGRRVGTVLRVWQEGQALQADMVLEEDSELVRSLQRSVLTGFAYAADGDVPSVP